MAFKMGPFPEDSTTKLIYILKWQERRKKKILKISRQQETIEFFNSIKVAN